MAYKVFTNGSTLQASEVNDNLMQQAVAVFSNSAARTAAITSPVEGQMTYLEDTNQYASWTGSAWVSPYGMTLLSTTNVSSATSVTVSNVFSSSFQNYVIKWTGTGAATSTNSVTFDLANSGTRANLSSWAGIVAYGWNSSPGLTSGYSFNQTGLATWVVGNLISGGEILIHNPAVAARTVIMTDSLSVSSSDFYKQYQHGAHVVSTAYDGFFLSCATALTGTLRVYGLRD